MVCAGALRPGAQNDNFAAKLLFQLQAGFERVGVGLVDLPGQIRLFDPGGGRIHLQLAVPRQAPA